MKDSGLQCTMHKIRLFCIPHAGGSATSFISWKKLLNDAVDLHPIELRGHGKRNEEPLYKSISDAVNDLYAIISPLLDDLPYALLGHSMGSIIAYELGRKIQQNNRPEPIHMFFSGRYPPYLKECEIKIHTLNDEQFIREFVKLGGLSAEFLENEALMNYMTPILHADCEIVENYLIAQEIVQFKCDISILTGTYDHTCKKEELERWKECTQQKCTIYSFDEDHFFLHKQKNDVIKVILRVLSGT